MSDFYQGNSLEQPLFYSRISERIMAMDLEVRNTAKITTLLATEFDLPNRLPLGRFSLFLSTSNEELPGVLLNHVTVNSEHLDLVLLLNQNRSAATIHDLPAVAVARQSDSIRDVQIFQPITLFGLWIYHRVNPHVVFGEVLGFVRLLMCSLTELGVSGTSIDKLSQHHRLLRS